MRGEKYYIIYMTLMFLVVDIRCVQTVRFESDQTCMLNVKWSVYPGKYRTFCHMSWLLGSLLWSCFADVSCIRRMEAIEIRYGQSVQGCITRVVHDYSCLYCMVNFQDTWLRIVVYNSLTTLLSILIMK